jgi:hypothetical protein
VSEEPAQETRPDPREGSGSGTAPVGHDTSGPPEPAPGPGRTPPGPHEPTAIERAGRWALWLGTGSMVLSVFQSIYRPVGLIFGIIAVVMGVRAHLRAQRQRALAPGAVAGIAMGAVAIAISIPVLAMSLFFRTEMDRYAECRASANTITDEQACKDAFARSLEKKVKLRQGSLRSGDIPF